MAGNHAGDEPKWRPVGKLLGIEQVNYLQPVVKGDNMIRCIEDILDILDDVMDTVNKMASTNIATFGAISANTKDIGMAAAMAAAQTSTTIFANTPCWRARIRVMGVRIHYLMPRSFRRISSRNLN